MCGIFGLASPQAELPRWPALAERMGRLLRHRGPDGEGVLLRGNAVLGAERLRIVDLDSRADQPFADPSGCVWLVGNGEIYNATDIRRRYPRYPFRSQSDIEVIIPLYLDCGLDALRALIGMFALALWDEGRRTLLLARDPAGEKPLFYSEFGGGAVAFASEVQAVLACPGVNRRLDAHAILSFLAMGCVAQPHTMFAGVRAVPPGSVLSFTPSGVRHVTYWDARAFHPVQAPPDAADRLDALLDAAVRRQLQGDVPIGVFTSGGLDSSLVTQLAVNASGPERIRTFTARFHEPSYDESGWGRALARRLGTQHVEVSVTEPDLSDAFATVTARVAEPIADPAVLPTLLLARAARAHVGVVLAGEGADELFGGYPTYLGHVLAGPFGRLPAPIRRVVETACESLPDSTNNVSLSGLIKRFGAHSQLPWRQRHLAWLGTGLDPRALLFTESEVVIDELDSAGPDRAVAGAMLADFRGYLLNQLLVKLDRATMLVGLEARAPYLDPQVAQFALTLDQRLRVRGLTTKWLLKRVAARHLPRRVARRRKRGLSVPIAAWIRGGLRTEVERLLDPARLRRQGLLSDVYVGRLLADHASGRANHARALWTIIVLQRWLERWAPEVA